MPGQSFYGPFLKKIPSADPFAGVDPGLAAAAGGPGAGTGVDPRTWQRGDSNSAFDWPDEDFQKSLGEAWMNNDLAAGYAKADQGSPAATGKVGQQRQMQPWEMPGSLFATSPMSYNPFIKKRQS